MSPPSPPCSAPSPAYIYAQKTGKGQVVDVAQFEAMAQYMCGTYTSLHHGRHRSTSAPATSTPAFQPYDLFKSKDGVLVALGAFGPGVYKRCIPAMGLDLEYFNYKDCSSGPAAVASEKGQRAQRQGHRVVRQPRRRRR